LRRFNINLQQVLGEQTGVSSLQLTTLLDERPLQLTMG